MLEMHYVVCQFNIHGELLCPSNSKQRGKHVGCGTLAHDLQNLFSMHLLLNGLIIGVVIYFKYAIFINCMRMGRNRII